MEGNINKAYIYNTDFYANSFSYSNVKACYILFTMIHTGNKVVITVHVFSKEFYSLTPMIDIKSETICIGFDRGRTGQCSNLWDPKLA